MNVKNSNNIQFDKMENFEVDNIYQPKMPSILQKKTILVALVAFTAIAGISSAIAGSFIVSALCASVVMLAITLVAVAMIRSKWSNDLLKLEVALPNNPSKQLNQSEKTSKPEARLQIASKEKLEKTLPLLLLPKEALSNLCTFLPLKDLGRFGCVNKTFFDFLGSATLNGQYTWKLIADKLGVSLKLPSEMSPKEQIKNLIIEFPEATLDLLNNKLIMKKQIPSSDTFIIKVFIQYAPKGYYLKDSPAPPGLEIIFYRQNDEIKGVTSPGWVDSNRTPAENEELYNHIINTEKPFEVVPFKDV